MALSYDLQFTGSVGTLVNNGGADYAPDTGAKWVGLPAFIPELDGSGNVAVPATGDGQRQAMSPSNMSTSATILVTALNHREFGSAGIYLRWAGNSGVGDLGTGGYRVMRDSVTGNLTIQKDSTAVATSTTFTGIYDMFNTAGAGDNYHITIENNGSSQPVITVWANGNTGTADLTYTDTSGSPYTAGFVGFHHEGRSFNNSKISRIQVYDTVFAPSGADPGIPWSDAYESPTEEQWTGFGPAIGGQDDYGVLAQPIDTTTAPAAVDGVESLLLQLDADALSAIVSQQDVVPLPQPPIITSSAVYPDDAAVLVLQQDEDARALLELAQPLFTIALLDGAAQVSASGAVLFTGAATTGVVVKVMSVSGAVVFIGSATASSPRNLSASGAVKFTGSATGSSPRNASASGAVVFTGAANLNVGTTARNVSASGAVVFTGSAAAAARVNASASGAVKFTGTSTLNALAKIAASGAVKFTGAATASSPRNVSASGAVVFTGSGTIGATAPRTVAISGVVVFTGAASAAARVRISSINGFVRFVSNQTLADEANGTGNTLRRRRRRIP